MRWRSGLQTVRIEKDRQSLPQVAHYGPNLPRVCPEVTQIYCARRRIRKSNFRIVAQEIQSSSDKIPEARTIPDVRVLAFS